MLDQAPLGSAATLRPPLDRAAQNPLFRLLATLVAVASLNALAGCSAGEEAQPPHWDSGSSSGSAMVAYIRGIGQTDFNPSVEPGVAIYVDDVYYSTIAGNLLDLLDLDRVEVLRGPQGTLAGRNAIGGAIKLFTRMGPFRHDKLHPTGSQRAAKILACLPPVDAASDSGEARAADSADVTMIELTDMARATLHGSVRVSIDGRPVGTLSTVGLTNPLRIRGLRAGEHRYELVVQVFTVDELLTINPSGSVRGGGIVMVERGAPLEVTWAADEAPTLRPATAPARTEAAPR